MKIEDLLSNNDKENNSEFIPVISDGDDHYVYKEGDGDNIPILALRNMVLFPGVIMPVALGRKKSLAAVKNAYKKKVMIGTFAQKSAKVEDPALEDLYLIGTMAQVLKILEMPDGTTSAILQGKARVKLSMLDAEGSFLHGNVEQAPETQPDPKDNEFKALMSSIKDSASKIIKNNGPFPPEASFAIHNIENTKSLINFICANLNFKLTDKQDLLDADDLKNRGFKLMQLINEELKILELKMDIQSKTQSEIEQQQREYFLQQQIKTIQTELGDGNSAIQDAINYRDRAKKKKWSKEVAELFEKEVKKLERISPNSPEYLCYPTFFFTITYQP